ncbi:MAG: CBS domain-containing protein [Acidobacteriota bacterium]|nr:MAG: CBS domain-containing protein [Acidobacteriota bacterium]
MGEHNVSSEQDAARMQAFMKALLADIGALQVMLESGRIESGVHRIGAEQEMFLIDRSMRPASIALKVLERADESRLTTEIGLFNLEANLSPRDLEGSCLRGMEQEIEELVETTRGAAREFDAEPLLCGILPTIGISDLSLEKITPNPRYYELNRAMQQLRGGAFNVHIKGLDEMLLTHDNVMLESCCASFQIHLQVGPEEFARLYNLAQAISAPILAAAANSPLLLGYRLWHETRIALFQFSTDDRSSARQIRNHPSRVSFGDGWVSESVIEIFREEIARFRIMLTKQIDEDPYEVLRRGGLPDLGALRLHNGTIWRWNRPCYGVSDGAAHLRIEHRPLPSGPTIIDEMANAAFFFGLMTALSEEYGEIDRRMSFDEVKNNFISAARLGLNAQMAWVDGHFGPVSTLILDHLLPLARQGLESRGVEDTDRYLGVLRERVERRQSGSIWSLNSIAAMDGGKTREAQSRALVECMLENQRVGRPVHEWEPAAIDKCCTWSKTHQIVRQFMTTDLFTVRPDDLVDLAASVMDWRHIRHVPVEDDAGNLVGLISHRDLLRMLSQGLLDRSKEPVAVKEIMKKELVTISPETPTIEALRIMQNRNVGCLPVVQGGRLVGLVTAYDFLSLSAEIIEKELVNAGVDT